MIYSLIITTYHYHYSHYCYYNITLLLLHLKYFTSLDPEAIWICKKKKWKSQHNIKSRYTQWPERWRQFIIINIIKNII